LQIDNHMNILISVLSIIIKIVYYFVFILYMIGIKAVIRITKFDDVKDALLKIGVEFFTYYDVRGVTFQAEQKGTYRGNSIMDSSSIQKRVLEIVIPKEEAEEVVECIKTAASTGVVGDGKIYTYEIQSSTRISS